MAQLNFPNQPWTEDNWHRYLAAARFAAENHDFDSGWIPSAGAMTIEHDLAVVPSVVHVHTSDNPDGSGFQQDTYSAVGSTSIAVAGTKAFTRVQLNK